MEARLVAPDRQSLLRRFHHGLSVGARSRRQRAESEYHTGEELYAQAGRGHRRQSPDHRRRPHDERTGHQTLGRHAGRGHHRGDLGIEHSSLLFRRRLTGGRSDREMFPGAFSRSPARERARCVISRTTGGEPAVVVVFREAGHATGVSRRAYGTDQGDCQRARAL